METGKVDSRTRGAQKAHGRGVRPGAGFGLGPMPLEWLSGSSWTLPSGKALAEFALQAGFLAPLMLQPRGEVVKKKVRKEKES